VNPDDLIRFKYVIDYLTERMDLFMLINAIFAFGKIYLLIGII